MKNHREDIAAQMGKRRKSVAETLIADSTADEKIVQLITYLPESQRKALKRRALEEDTSMSKIVVGLISEYLNK